MKPTPGEESKFSPYQSERNSPMAEKFFQTAGISDCLLQIEGIGYPSTQSKLIQAFTQASMTWNE